MIWCCANGLRTKCTEAEWFELADNYRAKILGGILTQLVLSAASQDTSLKYMEVTVDCDNNGVVLHGNSPHWALKENQAQADVLRVFKRLISATAAIMEAFVSLSTLMLIFSLSVH